MVEILNHGRRADNLGGQGDDGDGDKDAWTTAYGAHRLTEGTADLTGKSDNGDSPTRTLRRCSPLAPKKKSTLVFNPVFNQGISVL